AMMLIENGVDRKNIIFINRELSVFDFIQTDKDLIDLIAAYRRKNNPSGRTYIFIDEVQDIEQWEIAVNSLAQDYTVENEIFISGSNSKLLSGELATRLSGRYIEMKVFPFSYDEYLDIHGVNTRGRDSYLRYMNDGGLPELFHLHGEEVHQRYMEGLRDSIMLKDIVKRYNVKDVGLLENLFGYIVNNSANLLSVGSIMKYMKGRGSRASYETISSYIGYFQDAYLLHKSARYNVGGKELLAGSFKMYPNDQSYHNYLFPNTRFGKGYILEGIVYLELIRKGYRVETGIVRDGEIDFVATLAGRKLFIQVSYIITDEETAEREYRVFKSIKGEGEKYLVTLDDEIFPVRDGVRHIQAWNLSSWI
ncbi:MAG: ATP-binding protein, partial [Muribaculaceae bacterium]|nr:ATP-binding protein [Muribaculaceae bacterium]